MGSLEDLSDDLIIRLSSAVGELGRVMLSMTCKRVRSLIAPSGAAICGREALLTLGYAACRIIGMPASERATEALASAGDGFGLVAAARDGFPVGSGVAAAAAWRGDIDMLVWAWRMGARIDDGVEWRANAYPHHVARWLATQGCDMSFCDPVTVDAEQVRVKHTNTCKRRPFPRGRQDTHSSHPCTNPLVDIPRCQRLSERGKRP